MADENNNTQLLIMFGAIAAGGLAAYLLWGREGDKSGKLGLPGPASEAKTYEFWAVPGIENVPKDFLGRFAVSMIKLGFEPNNVSALISEESGWRVKSPKAENRQGGKLLAAGLPQLFYTEAPKYGATVEQLAQMGYDEQLPIVVKLFESYKKMRPNANWTPENLIMSNGGFGINKPDSTVLGDKNSADAHTRAVYNQNQGLAHGKTTITAGDLYSTIRRIIATAQSKPRIVVELPENVDLPAVAAQPIAVAAKVVSPKKEAPAASKSEPSVAAKPIVKAKETDEEWTKRRMAEDAAARAEGERLSKLPKYSADQPPTAAYGMDSVKVLSAESAKAAALAAKADVAAKYKPKTVEPTDPGGDFVMKDGKYKYMG